MRSSRRNLGLQPEVSPEDSDSNKDSKIGQSDRREQEQGEEETEAADQTHPVTSDEINIDDSALSKITSDSESEEGNVPVTG